MLGALVGAPLSLSAQDVQADPPSLAALGLRGHAVVKTFASFREGAAHDHLFRNEGRLQIEWGRRLAPWLDATAVVEARGDDAGSADGVSLQIPETTARRSVLDLKEAALHWRDGPLEITAGKQIFAWGAADAYNPTDLVNPYDFLDVLDHAKLGVWSVSARLTGGATSLIMVLVPVFTPSRLPLPNTRWFPQVPAGTVAVVDPRQLPPSDVGSVQYAARLRGTVKGWDIAASYYEGFKSTPAFRRSTVTVAPGVDVPRITPMFTRIRVAGLDWSTTLGKLELHGEAAFRFTAANGRDDRFQGIAGVNYTWDGLGFSWLNAITVVAEYAREEVLTTHNPRFLNPDDVPQIGDILAVNPFRNALLGRLELKLTEDTGLRLTGLVDLLRSPSAYAQIKVTHRLSDAWSFEAGVDVLSGKRNSFWGRWTDNDRVFTAVRFFF